MSVCNQIKQSQAEVWFVNIIYLTFDDKSYGTKQSVFYPFNSKYPDTIFTFVETVEAQYCHAKKPFKNQ